MTNEDFLIQETKKLIEGFKTQRRISPVFTLLSDDGSTTSIEFHCEKKMHKNIMQKICEDPGVIASIFTCEVWLAGTDETKSPSECDDRQNVIMLIYATRHGLHECHLYKPTKDGELELFTLQSFFGGNYSKPFNSILNMTTDEKLKTIEMFQKSTLETISYAYEKLHNVVPMMFFLTNTSEISLLWIPEEEWKDRVSLKQIISTKCAEAETLAFMLEFPVEPDMVSVILVSSEILEIVNYKINTDTQTLDFENKGIYDGEFSDLFKN